MTPTTGLLRSSEFAKNAPIFFPPRSLNESDRKVREQTKKYKLINTMMNFRIFIITDLVFLKFMQKSERLSSIIVKIFSNLLLLGWFFSFIFIL